MRNVPFNKYSSFVLLSILLLTFVNVKAQDKSKSFVKVNSDYNRYFGIENNKTWIPVMMNVIMPEGNEEDVFAMVEKYFKNFSLNSGNAVRIWISSPFLEIEDEQIGKFNPVKLKRIDRLVRLAEKYDIKIKFTLQHIRSIKPDLTWWSNRSFYSKEDGGDFNGIKDFVDSSAGRKVYLNRIKILAKRYRNEPQIFSWELWNEMDAVDDGDWFSFSKAMLDSVKMLFPNQLVVQTLGSMHSMKAEEQYEKLFELEKNEYITLHRYLDPGHEFGQYDYVRQPIDQLASGPVKFAYRDHLLKPVLVNEIGAVEENHKGPSKLYDIDTAGVLIHDMIYAPYFAGAAGCGSMWHWNVYVDKQNLWFHYKRFTHAIKDYDPVKERFVPFYLEKDSVRLYVLKGLYHTIFWCRDARNNWKTELQDGIPPEVNKNFSIDLKQLSIENIKSARSFDPWSDSWRKITPDGGKLTIPPFVRSVVVVLEK